MHSPAHYLATTATPEAAVTKALADAAAETTRLERYYRLLLRALRNTPAVLLPVTAKP